MPKQLRSVHSPDAGFTLTELLITIVILGVLAGIVVFAVATFTNDGKKVACETDRRNIQIAAEAYRGRNGAYPSGIDSDSRMGLLVSGGYLKELPQSTQGYVITLGAGGDVGPVDCTPS